MKYRVCSRCIIDTTVPACKFNEEGECNYCRIHDKLEKQFPLNTDREMQFERIIEKIKISGKSKKYDCIVGLSGGRDSTYSLNLAKQLGLRPLAVHFNDGFGNPVAGENMKKTTDRLGVDFRIVTSDWRESKNLKIAFLKASTPDLEQGTDVGIAATLYGVATKENVKYIISGFSFRTEGIAPLEWSYLDGRYLKKVYEKYNNIKLRRWTPDDPGFNLNIAHILYYMAFKRIKVVPLLCYVNYVRKEAESIIKDELGWVYPGAKHYDDLYQSLMTYIYRVKFNIDRRRFNYSALVRSGQMPREEALSRVKETYVVEDPKVIDLCIKRLGLTRDEIDMFLAEPTKTFRDYPSSYNFIKQMRIPIKILGKLKLIPEVTYDKYFECI